MKGGDQNRDDYLFACYLLFASLGNYLSTAPEGNSIAQAYIAWQRYNLIKNLYEENKDHPLLPIIANELATSYQGLVNLLEDEKKSYAFRVLWIEGRKHSPQAKDKHGLRSLNSLLWKIGLLNNDISDAQIRQRLRLSMFLQFANKPTLEAMVRPLAAPGCFQKKRNILKLFSRDITLHRRFQSESGKVTVHRFMNSDLLPQYDLKAGAFPYCGISSVSTTVKLLV